MRGWVPARGGVPARVRLTRDRWPAALALALDLVPALAGGLVLAAVPAVAAAQAGAPAVTLDGAAVQGALLRGRTAPGARVVHDGAPVPVSPDGRFVIGFGRDAGPRSRLEVALPDGTTTDLALAVGQRTYEVQRIDGLPEAQVTPPPEALARIRAERELIRERRRRPGAAPLFRSPFLWPARGVLSGVYGSQRILNGAPRAPHMGVDIAAPEGAPVVAPSEGVVVLAHEGMFFTGKTVMIDHGHGLTSVYAHMGAIRVREGEAVAPGTPIGTVGASGRATGPHLHWGVHLKSVGLDPALLAGEMPAPAGAAPVAGGDAPGETD